MLYILKILLPGPQKFFGGPYAARGPQFGHVWHRGFTDFWQKSALHKHHFVLLYKFTDMNTINDIKS
jgi:hypothetical protein